MTTAIALIPELDDIVQRGNPRRRAEAARRLGELFLQGAPTFHAEHVDLFDRVLVSLVPHAELAARVDLAERLSWLVNAPRELVGQLAREDEITIAGPLLRRSSVIDDNVLIEIAVAKGQPHLLAMSERPTLSSGLTDVIVHRGDREVVRRMASNGGAAFSTSGYSTLIRRAGNDGVLTVAVGRREDLSQDQLKELLGGAMDAIRRRLLDVVGPARQNAIRQAIRELNGFMEKVEGARDFLPAQQAIMVLHDAGHLNESALLGFAKTFKYEESIVALAAMTGVKIGVLDHLIAGDRYDPILIAGKAIGLQWATVRALIQLRLGPNRVPSSADMEGARLNFSRLMSSTAERVVGFWKTREA